MQSINDLVARVKAGPRVGRRRLVALAGAPASGKSTLAEVLAKRLNDAGCATAVIPMDGFHLHNQILIDRGLLNRKGAPDTFDARGFVHLVSRLHDEDEVYFPIFDRARDISIAGGGIVGRDCDTLIFEGNYLLLDAPVWRELPAHWDLSVSLKVPAETLEQRLVDRWLKHGLTQAQSEARAAENDMLNAELVMRSSAEADCIVMGNSV